MLARHTPLGTGRPGGEFPAVVTSHGATSTGALHLESDWDVHDVSNKIANSRL